MAEQQSLEENKAVEWPVKKYGWNAGEIWQKSKKSENRAERETTEECNPVLLTLYLIINEFKYTMLIIQL